MISARSANPAQPWWASRRAAACVVGAVGPIDHEQAEVGHGVAERADLPVEDGPHRAVGAEDGVVEPVVAVDDGGRPLLGDRRRRASCRPARPSRRGRRRPPCQFSVLLAPPAQLALDVARRAGPSRRGPTASTSTACRAARVSARLIAAASPGSARRRPRSAAVRRRGGCGRRRTPSRRRGHRSPRRPCTGRRSRAPGRRWARGRVMTRCSRAMSWAVGKHVADRGPAQSVRCRPAASSTRRSGSSDRRR